MHPFPVLNLKGKQVRRANCGHNFIVCLGNNISKELPSLHDAMAAQVQTNQTEVSNNEPRKKKMKKKKTVDGKKRSTS